MIGVFISYFNKNFIKINGLWRFLYNYNELVLFLTNAVTFIGLVIIIGVLMLLLTLLDAIDVDMLSYEAANIFQWDDLPRHFLRLFS